MLKTKEETSDGGNTMFDGGLLVGNPKVALRRLEKSAASVSFETAYGLCTGMYSLFN
jgi:hypothetical protein